MSSRAGASAALAVAVLLCVLGYKVVSIARASAAQTSYTASAVAPTDSGVGKGADWQQEMALLGNPVNVDPSATSSSDSLAMIGPMVTAQLLGQYAGLQDSGTYSSSTATNAASSIAANVRAIVTYKTYTLADITTDSDTSYNRMLQYRSDLRAALEPLLKNTNAELELYGKYVETSDTSYLTQLSAASDNYQAAADATAKMTVPRDAVNYHIAILNAMDEFAAVLKSMATHTNDPITNAALLRAYDQAEQDMFNSFNDLSAYYSQQTPQ